LTQKQKDGNAGEEGDSIQLFPNRFAEASKRNVFRDGVLRAFSRSETVDLPTPNFPAISEQVRLRLSSCFDTISVNFSGCSFRAYSELFGVVEAMFPWVFPFSTRLFSPKSLLPLIFSAVRFNPGVSSGVHIGVSISSAVFNLKRV
jgi:hypothetical protein